MARRSSGRSTPIVGPPSVCGLELVVEQLRAALRPAAGSRTVRRRRRVVKARAWALEAAEEMMPALAALAIKDREALLLAVVEALVERVDRVHELLHVRSRRRHPVRARLHAFERVGSLVGIGAALLAHLHEFIHA